MEHQSSHLRAALIVCVIGGLCAASAIGQAAARQPAGKTAVTRQTIETREIPRISNSDGELLHDVPPLNMAIETVSLSNTAAAAPAAPVAAAVIEHRPRVLLMEVTGYCPCSKCCGKKAAGITASGRRVTYNRGLFAAADTDVLPFDTMIQIPGYNNGRPIPVIDRGGAIKGNKLDLFFPTHKQALEWGRKKIAVTVGE